MVPETVSLPAYPQRESEKPNLTPGRSCVINSTAGASSGRMPNAEANSRSIRSPPPTANISFDNCTAR